MAGDMQSLKAWLKEEWANEDRRRANWSLLRSIAFFGGSIVLMRAYGDQLA